MQDSSSSLRSADNNNSDPEATSHVLDNEFQRCHKVYRDELPLKIDRIKQHWNALQCSQNEVDAAGELRQITHNLAGSCVGFGFGSIRATARRLEILFDGLLKTAHYPPGAELCAEIDTLIQALEDADMTHAEVTSPVSPTSRALHTPTPVMTSGNAQSAEGKLLFLVADEASLGRQLTQELEHYGYRVRMFNELSGLSVAVSATPPAAILMEMSWPADRYAGVAAIKNLRQNHAAPLPILFMSASAGLSDRLEAVRADGCDYLSKPIDIHELVEKLDTLTSRAESAPYRVLMVEDKCDVVTDYEHLLTQAGMEVVCTRDAVEAMQLLIEFQPDVIVIDVHASAVSGLELAAVIRQQRAYAGTPILFFSDAASVDQQLQALRRGVDAVLTKPIAPHQLGAVIAAWVQRARALQSLLVHDGLTGLLNRRHTLEQLYLLTSYAKRKNTEFSLCLLDIDEFKVVNDRYGHLTGDRVIKSLARFLRRYLRKTDVIGHYGGEEFVIILPDADSAIAQRLMNEVRREFSDISQYSETGEFAVTFSTGIAAFPTYDNPTLLVLRADEALYQAKRDGRNRVVVARQ